MKYQPQEIIDNASLGFTDIPVRFFLYDWIESFDEECQEFIQEKEVYEVNEHAFIEAEGTIEYERHTVFANGVKQICLTKHVEE